MCICTLQYTTEYHMEILALTLWYVNGTLPYIVSIYSPHVKYAQIHLSFQMILAP